MFNDNISRLSSHAKFNKLELELKLEGKLICQQWVCM